jgi:gamma-glutamyl hydrolase
MDKTNGVLFPGGG